jgi:hypothetical protein
MISKQLTVFYISPTIERFCNKLFRIKGSICIYNVCTESGVHVFRDKLGITLPIKCPTCEVAYNLVVFLWKHERKSNQNGAWKIIHFLLSLTSEDWMNEKWWSPYGCVQLLSKNLNG